MVVTHKDQIKIRKLVTTSSNSYQQFYYNLLLVTGLYLCLFVS